MEKEPLLPYVGSPRRKLPSLSNLWPLPEDDEFTVSLTPSEFKDRIIFGPATASPRDSSPLVDALTLPIHSPRTSRPPSSSSLVDSIATTPQDPQSQQPPTPQSWLIDPNYSWTKTNLHRSKTAPAMAVINEVANRRSVPRPQFGSQSIVRQAVVLLVIYLALGVIIYWFNRDHFAALETHPVVDALYFCIVTMCTIGYGDITPTTTATKLFSIAFVLVGFGFVDILLSGMVSYVLDLQENYFLRSLKGAGEKKESYIFDVKKGRMRIRMKVGLALGVVVLCIGIGVGVMHFVEKLGWLDSFYLSVMSVTTVGYGDQSPPNLTPAQSNRVCNALALLQCVASHPDTRMLFLNAHIPLYLYPFLNTSSKARPFEYLRLTSLGVIGALVKVDDTEVISFLLSTEIIPLCLRTMELGSELSKTVATFIVQKILLDDMGLDYICTTAERFFAVGRVLGTMVAALADQPSSRLLKHIIRCYLRLSDNPRACDALRSCLPDVLREASFNNFLCEDPTTRRWLQQLVQNVGVSRIPALQGGGGFDHVMVN